MIDLIWEVSERLPNLLGNWFGACRLHKNSPTPKLRNNQLNSMATGITCCYIWIGSSNISTDSSILNLYLIHHGAPVTDLYPVETTPPWNEHDIL